MSVAPMPPTSSLSSSPSNTTSKVLPFAIKRRPPSFWGVLIQQLHPNVCLTGCPGQSMEMVEPDIDLDDAVSTILPLMECDNEYERTSALQALYDLVGQNYKQYRIPLVCTTKWDIIRKLSIYISKPDECNDRRLICLILNNLSIPFENKAVMVLGESRDILLSSLLDIIRNGYAESYLACVCLMNLSYLDDAKDVLLQYIPPSLSTRKSTFPDNLFSLLCTLEQLIKTNAPFLMSPVISVEGQSVRWAMGFLRSVSNNESRALLVAETCIPSVAAKILKDSPHELCKWTKESLEDMTLSFLLQLVQFPKSLAVIQESHKEMKSCLQHIVGQGGIHDRRAMLIICRLENDMNMM